MRCISCGRDIAATPTETELPVGFRGAFIVAPVARCECGEAFLEFPPLDVLLQDVAKALAALDRPLRGAEIRFLRKRLDWTQARFAREFDVARETACRWEAGTQPMDPFKQRVLKWMGVHGDLTAPARPVSVRIGEAETVAP